MYYPLMHCPTEPAAPQSPEDQPVQIRQRSRRKGATAIEYLFMLSLIIAVLVLTIQHFGGVVGTLFTKTSTTYPTQGP
jgi:Flp pilus assembly pilin Flp